jgi:hypothetical protein
VIDLLLRLFGVYRLTYLAIHEDGPFELGAHARTLAQGGPAWVREGARCPLCVSFWLSLLVALLPAWAARWLGLAGLFLLWRTLEARLWRTVPTI